MKNLKKSISALLVAACLICMSIMPVLADTQTGVNAPSAADVRTEAKLTASYLMSNTNFTEISNSSTFYNASRNLILSIRSGFDCSAQTAAYLESVKSLLNNDGTLNVEVTGSFTKDIYADYAYLLLALAVTGNDASDFNGVNVVKAFDEVIGQATVEELTTLMNPYFIGAYYIAIDSYKAQLSNSEAALAVTKSALLTLCTDGQGVEYWGHSADNNGVTLPMFANLYNTDAEVKAQIDSATEYTKSLANEDGTITSWGYLSTDSTALALAMHAQYGDASFAALTYNGLISQCKSGTITGAYTPDSNTYASQDALVGLVTYLYALEGKANPFDVSAEVKAIADAKNNNTTPENPSKDNTANDNNNSNNNNNNDNNNDDNNSSTPADTNTDVSNTDSTTTSNQEISVQTGDSTNAYLYVCIAGMAVLAVGAACKTKKSVR